MALSLRVGGRRSAHRPASLVGGAAEHRSAGREVGAQQASGMRTLGGSCSKAGPPASCVVAKNSIGGFEGQTLKEFLSLPKWMALSLPSVPSAPCCRAASDGSAPLSRGPSQATERARAEGPAFQMGLQPQWPRSPPWNVWKTEWADFLSSRCPAKPLQVLYCWELRHSAMVMGHSFCICLERPKYFYIATNKAAYLKMNSISVVSRRGDRVRRVCLCVLPGPETAFSWGIAIHRARG